MSEGVEYGLRVRVVECGLKRPLLHSEMQILQGMVIKVDHTTVFIWAGALDTGDGSRLCFLQSFREFSVMLNFLKNLS